MLTGAKGDLDRRSFRWRASLLGVLSHRLWIKVRGHASGLRRQMHPWVRHSDRRVPRKRVSERPAVVDQLLRMKGTVCGPSGRTQTVASHPYCLLSFSTVASMSRQGMRCASRISSSLRLWL